MKLYHCHNARSLRPLWALEELGLDYELVNMPFPPRAGYPGYLAINPLGTDADFRRWRADLDQGPAPSAITWPTSTRPTHCASTPPSRPTATI